MLHHSDLNSAMLGKSGHLAMGTSRISPGHLAISTSRISPAAKPSPPHLHSRSTSPVAAFVTPGQRGGACHREGTRCFARKAQDSSQVRSPPGPPSVPMLGALSVIWDLLVQKVPFTEMLRDLRTKYGPLFLIQTGPAKQVWVSDPDMLRHILGLLECCGRPATLDDPFDGFLFFTADPEKAA